MAGCDTTVEFNFSVGPLKQTSARSYPRTTCASSNNRRAAGTVSTSALAMPTDCAPWPGNRNAMRAMATPDKWPTAWAFTTHHSHRAHDDLMLKLFDDVVIKVGIRVSGSHAQRVFDRLVLRAAVANDADAVDAQKRRAAELMVIVARHQVLQHLH